MGKEAEEEWAKLTGIRNMALVIWTINILAIPACGKEMIRPDTTWALPLRQILRVPSCTRRAESIPRIVLTPASETKLLGLVIIIVFSARRVAD